MVARSLLALALAVVAIPAVNLAGAWCSDDVFGLPSGGPRRLAADLGWSFLAGMVGAWLLVATAAVAKTAHAWAFLALYVVVALLAVVEGWSDFPRWFTIGLLLSLPLQVWSGWWLAWGRQRRRAPH